MTTRYSASGKWMMLMRMLLLGALVSLIGLVTYSAIGRAASTSDSSLQQQGSYPMGIAAGSDGNLWFTENDGIGRMTVDGQVSLFHVPDMVQLSAATASAACYCSSGIVLGPDGNIYFAEKHAIGRTTAGTPVSTLKIKPDYGPPQNLTVGPDHNLWFVVAPPVENGSERAVGDYLVRMTLDGHITWYHPSPAMVVRAMAPGPDGNLWLAVYGRNEIVRMTTTGRIVAQYGIRGDSRICGTICTLLGITAGSDGNMWFTVGEGMIGRISGTGKITLFPLARQHLLNLPFGIAVGPDGRLWFSEVVANRIGAVTTGGRVQEYTVPGAIGEIFTSIAKGGDHNMWFTQTCASNIGQVSSTGQVKSYHIPGASRTRDSWCPYFMP